MVAGEPVKVGTILDNIDSGAIALPEFQRGYVWNRSQVRGLMDSLYRGHPVGSLLTWQTRTESAVTRGDQAVQPGTVQLLLDGQQRITTLYGVIRGEQPRFFNGNPQALRELRFHLDDETFEYWQPVKMRDDPCWIDVTELMREGAGTMISKVFAAAGTDPGKIAQAQVWLGRLNRIDQIRERELHVELVTGEDKTVDIVVDIFNRVNSGGTKLSKGDLALAKVCAEWPEAREQMNRRLEKWKASGYELRLDLLLRVVNAIVTGRAPFSALSDRSPQEIRDGLERAEHAIDKILNTLASRLGLDHVSVVPSVAAFPVMARYLSDRGFNFADHRERDQLLYWYIQVAMWGRYAGSTETVLAQDLQAITAPGSDPIARLVANLRQQRGDLRVQPGDFRVWSRGARFFPILYMLTRIDGARDWGTGEQLDRHALGRHTDLEIHHIFPKRVLYDAGYARPEVNAIANFTFLSQETNRSISDTAPHEYLPELMARHPGAVESHWMPTEPEFWTSDRYPEFLERRRALLAEAANVLLDRLFHGNQPEAEIAVSSAAGPGPAPASVDDEERIIAEVREWIVGYGFDAGEQDYELIEQDGTVGAVLDLAWPRGLQVELSEPVALLLNESAEAYRVAARHGYRPFTDVDEFRTYAGDIETLGTIEPAVAQ
jgi:hypothetical protein